MRNLLQINASLFSDQGQSSQLADQFVTELVRHHPDLQVTRRNLNSDPVPHLDGERFTAFITKAEERSAEQQAIVAYSDHLIAELKAADILVLGVPMYNFGIPSSLKAYFDHIARTGLTFRYTDKGAEGLLTGKKAYIFAARGGKYVGTDLDSQTNYLKTFLGFVGITDIEFVYAEGLNMGEETRNNALTRAREDASRLAA